MPRKLSDWQDEIAANMLEDLAKITGIPFEDILASEVEAEELQEGEFREFPISGEPTDDLPFDPYQDYGTDLDNYLSEHFADIDVDLDDRDSYGDDNNG